MANHEDDAERLDRELIELLNELRVMLPGVQVLFAFLLTVPFSQRFEALTEPQRALYFAAFLCTTVASILLIAPGSYHRLRWREYDKERLLQTSNRFAIGGIIFLAASIGCVVYLLGDLLYSLAVGAALAGAAAAALAWFWFGLPLSRSVADGGTRS